MGRKRGSEFSPPPKLLSPTYDSLWLFRAVEKLVKGKLGACQCQLLKFIIWNPWLNPFAYWTFCSLWLLVFPIYFRKGPVGEVWAPRPKQNKLWFHHVLALSLLFFISLQAFKSALIVGSALSVHPTRALQTWLRAYSNVYCQLLCIKVHCISLVS